MRPVRSFAAALLLVFISAPSWGAGAGVEIGGPGLSEYSLELAKGNIPGHAFIAKFGENPDIVNTGVFEDVWDGGGVYVPPTVARLHNVASSLAADAGTVVSSGTLTGGSTSTIIDTSADFVTDSVVAGDVVLNDSNVAIGDVLTVDDLNTITLLGAMRDPNTGLAGAANDSGDSYRIVRDEGVDDGISILHILGLSASRLEQEEFVVLNGASAVATANTYIRQYRGRVFSAGGTNNLGVVTSTAQTDGTVSMQIGAGNNQTLMALYTCPVDKTCYLLQWWAAMSKAAATAVSEVHLRAGAFDAIPYKVMDTTVISTGSSRVTHIYPVPIPVPGGADIWIQANANANSVGVSAGFDIIKVDN